MSAASSEPMSSKNLAEALRQTVPLLPRLIPAALLLITAPALYSVVATDFLVRIGWPYWVVNILDGLAEGSFQGLYVGIIAVLLAPRLGLIATVKPVDRSAGWIGWISILLFAGLLKTIVVSVGFVLLLIPGIIASCMLFAALPVAALERRDPSGALSRSRALTQDYRFGIFGVLLVFGIAIGVVGFAGMIAFGGGKGFRAADLQPAYRYGYLPLINVIFYTLLGVLQTNFYVRRALRTSAGAQSVAAVFD
jgi:hypothetical protein